MSFLSLLGGPMDLGAKTERMQSKKDIAQYLLSIKRNASSLEHILLKSNDAQAFYSAPQIRSQLQQLQEDSLALLEDFRSVLDDKIS